MSERDDYADDDLPKVGPRTFNNLGSSTLAGVSLLASIAALVYLALFLCGLLAGK